MSPEQQKDLEIELLRDFYACWCTLHSSPRDPRHRSKLELAAQRLVDAGHAVAAYQRSLQDEKPRLEVVN